MNLTEKSETIIEVKNTLTKLLSDYEGKGLLSIYLWGSIITPDFDTQTSDIDAIGILSERADHTEFLKIREWLPKENPKLVRLQINFFYLCDLIGENPMISVTDRPCTPGQAAFEFPNMRYICGQKISFNELMRVSPVEFLKDQFKIVHTRELWAKNPKTKMDSQYFCKSLVWLCVAIHRLNYPASGFSWKMLQEEANENTSPVVQKLLALKQGGWDTEQIQNNLPYLYEKVKLLTELYS